ncbi:methyltransferase [Mycobacterium simiae]|uniref:Hydroxyneurosporene methyltransferase n=1 Tax=Mycobacterium simiae TaxID=1784 RepID=A0A1X0YHT2_MYCSI|nr:methyltransferase [Mycobacterium simiae]ORJ64876.1 hydroxyneurosporene methyltransferase [Mycobacterium simiae]
MISSKIPSAHVAGAIELVRDRLARLHRRLAPAPAVMMEMILDAWAAQAITAAAELGIADALTESPLTADELAAVVGADAGAVSRLLRALITRGIFRQRRDGRYDLTPLGDSLRSDVDISIRAVARFVGSRQHREHWSHLADAIRTGRAVIPDLRGKSLFEYFAEEPQYFQIFNDAMTSLSELAIAPVIAGYDFTRYSTIVDVGGGHGRMLAAILAATPQSRGILFDQPDVVAGAAVLLEQYDVVDRVEVVGGSFFDGITAGGDAYLLKNVIHDWPDDDAVRILRNVRSAAGADKHVLLVEFVIPEHHREFLGNWLDLEMLTALGARERTAAEYSQLLSRAGLQMSAVVATASPFSVVEAVAI